ncbi:MAG: TetR/AcrR family transcriptional regulator [Deltaproteobacteria bacterium]|nr:TetR/AcrR family transcriptional regulator [Deltaproteobacteria bacterium]
MRVPQEIHAEEIVATPRARRRAANLEKILHAAMQMVTEEGFGGLSMNKLAGTVDYTPGALYRYFDSKDALLGALVNQVLDEVRAVLVVAAELVPEDRPLARLFALTRGYRRFSVEESNKFSLLAMSMAEPRVLLRAPEVAEPVVHSMIATLSPIADALAVAEAKHLLSPGSVPERTVLVFASVQGIVQLRKQARVAPELLDLDRLVAMVVRTLLLGWGADEVAVDDAFDLLSGGPS